ncbi:MAG: P-II family nitrogen regulator [bacterium]|nr:P-II family nitrogen regulator [bacterium]
MAESQDKKNRESKDQGIVLVVCTFRIDKLEQFKQMAKNLNLPGATVTKILGFGRQKGHIELFRGDEYSIEFIDKYKAEMLVLEEQVPELLEEIREYLRTGRIGDGKVYTVSVDKVMRIRTGENGKAAI